MKYPEVRWRNRAKNALTAYFRKRSLRRFLLWDLLLVTGLSGFFVSYGLLKLGIDSMAVRYPVAVLGAYGVFLGVIRLWVEWERTHFDPESEEFQHAICAASNTDSTVAHPAAKASSGRWFDWLDGLDIFELPFRLGSGLEGCLPAIGFLAIVALGGVLISLLLNAEVLLAEGFIDTFLVVGLYRRLKIAAREHGLGTTLRKTWKTAALVAVILAVAGGFLQHKTPEARSIGPALHALLYPNP